MTDSGFAKVPDTLALDAEVSLAARALYPILLALAWKTAKARADEEVELPPLAELAPIAGCSETALKGYVRELREAGWVTTRRAARGRPQRYVIHGTPCGAESDSQDGVRGADSVSRVGRIPTHSRARVPSPADLLPDRETTSPCDEPPAIVRVGGRNLPLDALAEVCGIDPASPRYIQAVGALNGRLHKTTGLPLSEGITHLFWRECVRYADEHGEDVSVLHDEPERYAEALARGIRRKASRYREVLRGATMSPTALRDWWLDLEKQPAHGNGGLTPDEMERFPG